MRQASPFFPAMDYALRYARLGFPVLPLRPGSKVPATSHGFKDATTDINQIRAWYEHHPERGVGIYPAPADLVVLDIDEKNGAKGSLELESLEARYGSLPPTLVQRTPSGGRHHLFRLPRGVNVGNAKLSRSIDVRNAAGYIAAEPTVIDGIAYRFEDWDVLAGGEPLIAEAPNWLVEMLVKPPSGTETDWGIPAVHSQSVDSLVVTHLRSAINTLDPDDYDVWIDCGMRLKGLGFVGREIWMTWSGQSARFDPGQAAKKWDGFQPNQTGYKAIFWAAQNAGWVNPMRAEARPVRGLANAAGIPDADSHPLAQWVELKAELTAPRWIIPGFIGDGLVIFAGAHGLGKTTALLPLALKAAGLHLPDDPLAPLHWRRVIYVTEDVDQVQRILHGLVRFGSCRISFDLLHERLRLVAARRLPASEVVKVASDYSALSRLVDGVTLPPLVVFDTKSAVLDLDDENANSEASAAISQLKQNFEGLPIWLVTHVAKANIVRNDAQNPTARGASAWEADANQVLYLVEDRETRYLRRGKTRFEGRWAELEVRSFSMPVQVCNEFGVFESLTLRWANLIPPEVTSREASKQAQLKSKEREEAELREGILELVQAAWLEDNPLNRTVVRARIGGNYKKVGDAIENLVHEGWIHEIPIPKDLRVNNKKSSFLVALSTREHDEWKLTKVIPQQKDCIPASWRKNEAPVRSESEQVEPKQAGVDDTAEGGFVCSEAVRSSKGFNGRNGRQGPTGPMPVPTVLRADGVRETDGNERKRTKPLRPPGKKKAGRGEPNNSLVSAAPTS